MSRRGLAAAAPRLPTPELGRRQQQRQRHQHHHQLSGHPAGAHSSCCRCRCGHRGRPAHRSPVDHSPASIGSGASDGAGHRQWQGRAQRHQGRHVQKDPKERSADAAAADSENATHDALQQPETDPFRPAKAVHGRPHKRSGPHRRQRPPARKASRPFSHGSTRDSHGPQPWHQPMAAIRPARSARVSVPRSSQRKERE